MLVLVETKVCSKCKKEYPRTLEYFSKNENRKYGLGSWCKNCDNERSRKYRENNLEKRIESQKKWNEKNPDYYKNYSEENKEKLKLYQKGYGKIYRKKNKSKRNEYKKKYERERLKTDPIYRLRVYFSTAIRQALRKKGSSKKGYSWEKIVNYTVKDLMKHLEKQFTEGMTWENYGKWHIDHIIPQSVFSFTSYEDNEFQECWVLSNLQPLWAQDNRKKSNKIIKNIKRL